MKCTYRAAKLLEENQKLKVHSVYHNTVNIAVGKRILAFHRDTISCTPLSLALPFSEEEFEFFEWEAQRTGVVNLCCCQISTGDFEKSAGEMILWEDRLGRKVQSDLDDYSKKYLKNPQNLANDILTELLPVITRNSQLGGFADSAVTTEKRKEDSFITQILREKTAVLLAENKDADFEAVIRSLIGLGPGLTPSGDDFLTGMLLAYSLMEKSDKKQKQICKIVRENLDRTNDISREYLLCAMENRFGELYHKLWERLYSGNVYQDNMSNTDATYSNLPLCSGNVHQDNMSNTDATHTNLPLCFGNVCQDIFDRIVCTGHSSGLDTLNGLAVGLKINIRSDLVEKVGAKKTLEVHDNRKG